MIWDRYHRVGRPFKSKILDEFCTVGDYLSKAMPEMTLEDMPNPGETGVCVKRPL